jgi:hypothetical protein
MYLLFIQRSNASDSFMAYVDDYNYCSSLILYFIMFQKINIYHFSRIICLLINDFFLLFVIVIYFLIRFIRFYATQDREQWRSILKEAKVHQGL